MTPALLKLATSGILTYAMEADKKDANENQKLENLKNNLSDVVNNYFASLNKIKQQIDKRNDNVINKEVKTDYNELHTKIKTQISKAYGEISRDSVYRINGIVNNKGLSESLLLEVNNTSTNASQETTSDWLDEIIGNANLYNNTSDKNKILENFKMALADVKVVDKDGKTI